ncbi:hypothetical protein BGZ65_002916 [Modicella reniformis]|uniref:Uncharacterized protein n=1 Tax=Modicella reniformis TaxID=1440133 RepID=A0A9P6SNE0_9FUNG|nr:hypothetical protein BGZ65_002916 [Modicella reniformis]
MRSLTVATSLFPELESFGSECRRLTSLSLGPFGSVSQPKQWCSWLKALVAVNPSIDTLQFHLHDQLDHNLFRKYNVLEDMPALKNLAILNDRYPVASSSSSNGVFEAILECGPRLDSLSYEVAWGGAILEVGCVGSNIQSMASEPWNLSSLNIYDKDGRREMELLKLCPNLRQYKTRVDFRRNAYESLQQLTQNYKAGHPSCLEHLEISLMQGPWTAGALEELLRVSGESTGLKTFNVLHSGVSESTMQTLLVHHAKTLEKVVMNNVPWPNPGDLELLLTTCPRLKHLEIPVWSETPWLHNLVKTPWVCKDLEILHLKTRQRCRTPSGAKMPEIASEEEDEEVAFTKGEISPQRQFWNRLGALKNLRMLHLNSESKHRTLPRIISIVHEDLESLTKLKLLQEFEIPPWEEFMNPAIKEELQLRRPDLHVNFINELLLLS